jgi:hypothetical protein
MRINRGDCATLIGKSVAQCAAGTVVHAVNSKMTPPPLYLVTDLYSPSPNRHFVRLPERRHLIHLETGREYPWSADSRVIEVDCVLHVAGAL